MEKHTFIISEKPDAAYKIAMALDSAQKARRMSYRGVPYYVATRDKEIVVVPAFGHLYTVAAKGKGKSCYPIFDFEWVPRFLAEKKAQRVRTWIQAITKLSKNADTFIDACDFDMEGSIIGYCVLKYACLGKEKTARRMKFSTLTKEDLERSYLESLPHLDFPLIEAGKARHEVDWLYGINLSRALTLAAKNQSGKYSQLSTGRVQGPLLRFLVSRERSIRCFVPTPFWRIKAHVEVEGKRFLAEYAGKAIRTRKEAESISNSSRGNGLIEKLTVRQFQQFAPVPFDLGTLQVEAYNLFGYNPKTTSDVAQKLYLEALISYPRTGSQKLPPTIGYKSILQGLGNSRNFGELTTDLLAKNHLRPHEGSRDDPAHPAIYPTGRLPGHFKNKTEENVWELIVRRFMTSFGESSTEESIEAGITVNDRTFILKGRHTLQQGWQRFYTPYLKLEEPAIWRIQKGQVAHFKKVVVEDEFTSPASRYNPSSLLQKMEEAGIGTKATRADIIQKLYERRYIRNERMTVTTLGLEVFDVLDKYCQEIVSADMTEELEERMTEISSNREKREAVIASAIEILKPALKKIKNEEAKIGWTLNKAIEMARLEENSIGSCPICKTGKLLIINSKKSGKRFVGCTNYFKSLCNASFALPQRGAITPQDKVCRDCGWPTIEVRIRRKARMLCFNPDCATKNRGGKRKGCSVQFAGEKLLKKPTASTIKKPATTSCRNTYTGREQREFRGKGI